MIKDPIYAKALIANLMFAINLLEKQVESGELPIAEADYLEQLHELEAHAACCNKAGPKQYTFSLKRK